MPIEDQEQQADPQGEINPNQVGDGTSGENPYVADDPELMASNNLAPDGTTKDADAPADDAAPEGAGSTPAPKGDIVDRLVSELGEYKPGTAAPATTPPTTPPAATGAAPAAKPADGAAPAADPAATQPTEFETKLAAARDGLVETLNLTPQEAERVKPLFDSMAELHKTATELRAQSQAQQVRMTWMGTYTKVTPFLDHPERLGTIDPFAEDLGLTEQNVKDFRALDQEACAIIDRWKSQGKQISNDPKDDYSFANALKAAERRVFGAAGPVDKRREEGARKAATNQKSMTLPPGRARPAAASRTASPYAGHPQAEALEAARSFMDSRRNK